MRKQAGILFALMCFVSLSIAIPISIANAEEISNIEKIEDINDVTNLEATNEEVLNNMPSNSISDNTVASKETVAEESGSIEPSKVSDVQVKTVTPQSINLDPMIYIDVPTNNKEILNQPIQISGWALNSSGVKEVKILLDGSIVGNATIGIERKDVDRAYPGYPNGVNSGFEYLLDVTSLKPGSHKITVKAIGVDGTSHNSDVNITIVKPMPLTYIDTPTSNATIQNKSIEVSGWALNGSGIKEVQIAVDGTTVGNVKVSLERADVDRAYPGYPNGKNSGFEYLLDVSSLKLGIHNITVKAIGEDGTSQSSSVKVTISKPAPIMYIEAPAPTANINLYISDQINVSGWTLNASGVKEVQIAVDGAVAGTAKIGLERADVDKAYPGYTGGVNSGYEYALNISTLKPGAHTITVKSIGSDGTSQSKSVEINIVIPQPKIYIDSPRNLEKVNTSEVKIAGWALHASGVKQVRIIVNGQVVGDARVGIERVDVDQTYPGYKDGAFSGFEYILDVSKFSTGDQVITVEAIGNDNTSVKTSTTIQIYSSIVYQNSYYDITLNEVVNIQMANNPQTDLYGGGWKTATWEDTAQKINSNNFIDTNVILVSNSNDEMLGVGKITASPKLNVRNEPTTEGSTIVALVDEGKEYTIIGQSNGWYKITTETGVTGWISGAYVEISYTNSSKLTTLKIEKALNVRSEPNTATNNNFALARVGEKYTIQGQTNGWYKIKVGNKYGWIEILDNRGQCISIVSNAVTGVSNPLYTTVDQISTEMYQFLVLSGSSGISVDDLSKELVGKGILEGKAQAFIDAGKLYNINEVYLLSHVLLETGDGKSSLANGILVTSVNGQPVTPKIVYNMYGIGAIDSNPLGGGAEYAYNAGWFTPEDAIIGGAKFIGQGYIDKGQDTLYKIRWNPLNPGTHQYASDIGWASKQTKNIEMVMDICKKYGSAKLIFDIPVYR